MDNAGGISSSFNHMRAQPPRQAVALSPPKHSHFSHFLHSLTCIDILPAIDDEDCHNPLRHPGVTVRDQPDLEQGSLSALFQRSMTMVIDGRMCI